MASTAVMIPSLVHLRVSGNLGGELDMVNVDRDLLEKILSVLHEPAEMRRVGRMLSANNVHQQLGGTYLERAEGLMEAARALGLGDEAARGQLGAVNRLKVATSEFEAFLLLLTKNCLLGLSDLDLTNCGITGLRMVSLSGAILQGGLANCRALKLNSNDIDYADMEVFGKAVGALGSLVLLDLSFNRIGDKGTKEFSSVIANGALANCQYLYLQRNQISDPGMVSFSDAIGRAGLSLGSLANLRELGLSFNQIGDVGLSALADAVRSGALPRLETLFLDETAIGDVGMQAFASAVTSGALANCQVISLNNNQIGDVGMQAFSDAIRSGALPRLELLALAENAIGDAGVTALAGAITRGALPSCIYIGLSGNPNSDETRQALQDARKNRQNFTVEL